MPTAVQIILVCFILVGCKTFATLQMEDTIADSVIVDDVAFIKLGTYSKKNLI